MALALVPGRASKCDAVVERAVVGDLGGLSDDDAHAVVDEEAPADGGARMDLDAREPARQMGREPRKPLEARLPQAVGESVEQHGVETRVASDYFPRIPGRRITLEHDRDFFSYPGKHLLEINDKGAQLTMSY